VEDVAGMSEEVAAFEDQRKGEQQRSPHGTNRRYVRLEQNVPLMQTDSN
jgi:hypothetical protein